MLAPPVNNIAVNNDDNGWQQRAKARAVSFLVRRLESERSPNRENALRGVHWSPHRPG